MYRSRDLFDKEIIFITNKEQIDGRTLYSDFLRFTIEIFLSFVGKMASKELVKSDLQMLGVFLSRLLIDTEKCMKEIRVSTISEHLNALLDRIYGSICKFEEEIEDVLIKEAYKIHEKRMVPKGTQNTMSIMKVVLWADENQSLELKDGGFQASFRRPHLFNLSIQNRREKKFTTNLIREAFKKIKSEQFFEEEVEDEFEIFIRQAEQSENKELFKSFLIGIAGYLQATVELFLKL